MESFSLLKYWRGGGGAALASSTSAAANMRGCSTTTIATSALRPAADDTDDDESSAAGADEGPFFDLEFAVPEDDEDGGVTGEDEDDDNNDVDDELGEEREVSFTVSSSSEEGSGSDNPTLALSPSDDLFFKGRLVPIEVITTAAGATSDASDAKPPLVAAAPLQFPVALLKSATKFRVLMLGALKKPRPSNSPAADDNAAPASPKHHQKDQLISKLFIKFKAEEVPIMSLFTRDGSKSAKPSPPPDGEAEPAVAAAAMEEKKFSREAVQRYISKIKPLYIRVSRRYGDKLRFSGQLSPEGDVAPKVEPGEGEAAVVDADPEPAVVASCVRSQRASIPAGLRVVRKKFGKSKSASAAVAAAPAAATPVAAKRRDDSLLELQDGIQSAIAHCKRSFNATSKGSESPLVRSMSDPGDKV